MSSKKKSKYNSDGVIGDEFYYYGTNPRVAFEIEGVKFFGTGVKNVGYIAPNEDTLIINASSSIVDFDNFLGNDGPSWFKFNEDVFSGFEVINLNWPDMSPPPLFIGAHFWQELFDSIMEQDHIKRVVCCCSAGQGRTGTLLSIFALVSGLADNPRSAVNYMRYNYNRKAVETDSQYNYLQLINRQLNIIDAMGEIE